MESNVISVRDGVGVRYDELPKLNIELLRECVAWVDRQAHAFTPLPNEPHWNQASWSVFLQTSNYCGSAYCVCGYALYTTGGVKTLGELLGELPAEQCVREFGVSSADELTNHQLREEYTDPSLVGYDGNLVDPSATEWGHLSWSDGGQAVLGLTETEALKLFHGDNSSTTIKALAAMIAESRGLKL
jgi:hypothetical protein